MGLMAIELEAGFYSADTKLRGDKLGTVRILGTLMSSLLRSLVHYTPLMLRHAC